MTYHQPFQVIGFHSCDKDLALQLLRGSNELRPSNNPWDWLGPGIYFWEQNPYRALEYAMEAASQKQKINGSIRTPFIIGAIIELGRCLNLIEPNAINIVKEAYTSLDKATKESGESLPQNKGANRALDCAVIKYIHQSNVLKNEPDYDTVRSPFQEGGEIYANANFSSRLHIEICVRNVSLIKGYFLPQPVKKFNPFL
ncbi:hypothetical protein QTN47_21675 [Danxiaibacter flavus]|uniref:Uncharacterized protein n=1 Tax=Danxiaibacter flavus TaxID=3049108 RepID=A0ABV3ZM09_9BACT|nr:hypothetical protein QNM32_21680 [Chitinophagaceae bacterium DXS]